MLNQVVTMARRKSNGRFTKNSARRNSQKYKKAINLKEAALGYLTAGVVTQGLFNQSPAEFVMGSTSAGLGSGLGASSGIAQISLRELFEFDRFKGSSTRTLGEQVMLNAKSNAFSMIGGLAGIAAAKKILPATGIPRNFNKLVRSIGLGQLVKM